MFIQKDFIFDFGVFGRGKLLNEKNELLLAHLRGDADFEENLAEYHRCRKAKKPKADASRIQSTGPDSEPELPASRIKRPGAIPLVLPASF